MRSMACVTVCVSVCLLVSGGTFAVEEGVSAKGEFNNALELIKVGNVALERGAADRAYCLYDEATTKLNWIKEKHLDWNSGKVMKQIKTTMKAMSKIEESSTKSLMDMRQSRYRSLMWQKQVLMIGKLDSILVKLDHIESEQDENQDIIKTIENEVTK